MSEFLSGEAKLAFERCMTANHDCDYGSDHVLKCVRCASYLFAEVVDHDETCIHYCTT